jgi:hypothetical protein
VRGRVAGVLFRPRVTMAEICARPTWAPGWLLMLVVWAACGTWLISTPVGQQALVDERVRIVEAFGGTLDEAEYASLLARPPWQMYFTSGGRLLLTPPVTLLVAGGTSFTRLRSRGVEGELRRGLAEAAWRP